jgi:hypothetical protein
MPSVKHEAPLELLRNDPQLAAVLLHHLGVPVPAGSSATMVSADLSASVPTEFRADAVVVLSDDGGARMAVVVEVQLRYDRRKRYSWPTYLTQVRAVQHCPAILLVICTGSRTATRCRKPIRTGHPGFDLMPLVIDRGTVPEPGTPGTEVVAAELAVLGVVTGAMDLEQDSTRRQVLGILSRLDDSRQRTYTMFVRSAASDQARQALEDLMTTKFRDDFIDRYLAEGEVKGRAEGEVKGRAEGEARIVLRILAARGLQVPDKIREQVLACQDTSQLETWADRAATADSVDDVFGN